MHPRTAPALLWLITAVVTATLVACASPVPLDDTEAITVPSGTALALRVPGSCTALNAATSRGGAEAVVSGLEAARVIRVIDGDTVELADRRRLRYIGINTPELASGARVAQFFALEAREANRRLVEGREVLLQKDVSETDRFGRLLRYVYVDGIQVNAELVREGYAQSASYPPDIRYQDCFRALQREARDGKRGLWANR